MPLPNIGWNFDNTYTRLPTHLFTRILPTGVYKPQLLMFNHALSQELGLKLSLLDNEQQAQLFSGNILPQGAEPIAQAYAGHQFGHFTCLGDGRAHLLGEHKISDGRRVDIQLKGSGKTPYSRSGDGRAALAPMLREYLISEAMHGLRIPTTRSLAVVTTGEQVYRETVLPGAILTRVAASHLRIGTFEYAAAKNDTRTLKALADYTIAKHFPALNASLQPYLQLLHAVIKKQVDLIVHWMRIGFIHGVMNTDNMALSGETIDYGPCAFMDVYYPATVFSSIDRLGRYAYANQPLIAQWNLARFAETLLPLLHSNQERAIAMAEEILNEFPELYHNKWLTMMRAKLGLFGRQQEDEQLIIDLLSLMQQHHADYTNTFRDLSQAVKPGGKFYDDNHLFQTWYERWQLRLKQNKQPLATSFRLMREMNPAVIPRNHQVEQSLQAAMRGDMKPLQDFLIVLKEPYTERPELKPYQATPTASERVYQTFCGT
ncbi:MULTISPECIES: protein adenylyltransferase SelO [Legionella]|uniref:protein adenylyltransferase SelO n=1 Tax=Legionella TaxID=445 RepID=UPI000F8E95AC|nr:MULTISPECIES: YdiU family protein [Legionella]MCP0914598.1 YdiU family protein [Legionella sp. 27cVA30]RUQ96176.1 YdiU family protein [Legionella septentrionalis]